MVDLSVSPTYHLMINYLSHNHTLFSLTRYAADPKELWKWLEPFLEDEEEFGPTADPDMIMTMGDFVRSLITSMNYRDTGRYD